MKILNGYAGLGGNRKLWGDNHEIVAVEQNEEIADSYSRRFKNDKVIIGDCHQHLLDHYEEYDFAWLSTPCPTHSKMARVNHYRYGLRQYPDMRLYQEILFLKEYFKGSFVVENVKPYYKPLIEAQEIERHLFWTNFKIQPFKMDRMPGFIDAKYEDLKKWLGFDDFNDKIYVNKNHDPCQVLRNCVHPELGLHVLNCAMDASYRAQPKQTTMF